MITIDNKCRYANKCWLDKCLTDSTNGFNSQTCLYYEIFDRGRQDVEAACRAFTRSEEERLRKKNDPVCGKCGKPSLMFGETYPNLIDKMTVYKDMPYVTHIYHCRRCWTDTWVYCYGETKLRFNPFD
jgi:hypothetical protein